MIKQNIYEIDTLHNIVRDLKGRGLKIGLTHGAFDLFHYSHLDLLRIASQVCDYLIVGLEMDKEIAKWKGENRPVTPLNQRIEIISSLTYVNAAFVNNVATDTQGFSDLYRELMVDFVFIGRHFGFEDRIAKQAEKGGAELIKIQAYEDPNTTEVIEKIIKTHAQGLPDSKTSTSSIIDSVTGKTIHRTPTIEKVL